MGPHSSWDENLQLRPVCDYIFFPPVSRRFLRRVAWKIGRRKHARQEGLAEEHCPVDAEADKAAQVTLWVSSLLSSSQGFLRAGLLPPSLHKTGIFKVRGEAISGAVLTQLRGNCPERVVSTSIGGKEDGWLLLLVIVTASLAGLVSCS